MLFGDAGKVVEGRRQGFCEESAAVDPHHDRLLLGLVIGIDPDVQVKAVLGFYLLNAIYIAKCTESILSVVLSLKDPVARVNVLRRPEAALAHRRLCIGYAQPRRDPVLFGSDEGAVYALHGMSLVIVSRDLAV